MIKKYLPEKFKKFLWFVFKSPQRKWIGFGSLWTDMMGYLAVVFKRRIYTRVSVCIGVKNRSYNLVEHVVRSLNRCEFSHMVELSVYDCGSDDLPDLRGVLSRAWKGRLVYQRVEQEFARSVAFNAAVEQAGSEYILVCDADMSLPVDVISKVIKYSTPRSAWFPVVTYVNEDHSIRPYTESTGMFASRKKDFIKAGRYDESIRTWGKEDWLLYFGFYKKGIAAIRTRERDFVHHYHPSLKPHDFVPLF
jgi:glycosyltransferase involved in cell wall biosynthesis